MKMEWSNYKSLNFDCLLSNLCWIEIMNQQFVICIKNDDYPASLKTRKLYQVVSDPDAEKLEQLRIVDESGEDYLYPQEYFISVSLPNATEQAIIKAA